MNYLSYKQQNILRFIRDFQREFEYAPSFREIRDACGLSSTSVVQYNLRALERLGHLRMTPGTDRSIVLIGRRRMMKVPIVGILHSGVPIIVPDFAR